MADYVLRVFQTVSDDPLIRGFITNFAGSQPHHEEKVSELGITWVGSAAAIAARWDLIVLADHRPLRYASTIPKILISHGPGHGRVVRGGSYFYEKRRVLWPDGRRVYDLILDSRQAAVNTALADLPTYKGHIRVVGDLRADELLDAARAAPRPSLCRTRVAVMSTWTDHGLFPRHGDWIISELARLSTIGEYEFVLTMHPNLWDRARAGTDRWIEAAKYLARSGIEVIGAEDDWAPRLASTDLAIVDPITSLASAYSVLGRPIVTTEAPISGLNSEGLGVWLLKNAPVLTGPGQIEDAIERSRRTDSMTNAPTMVEFAGESVQRTREAVLDVLRSRSPQSRDKP